MNGILIIDKREGITSHRVVARMRRCLHVKRIGHTGTLDPFATGVLVVLVGKASRLAQFLNADEKAYEATIQFGNMTETGDLTGEPKGEVLEKEKLDNILDNVDWGKTLTRFQGKIKQVPPMYSAKKVKGKKLYELARAGIEIERKPIEIRIDEIEVLQSKVDRSKNRVKLLVECSAGTYIRTLAEDIGNAIGVPCHLTKLRRTRAGKFNLEDAIELGQLEENPELFLKYTISMNDSVSHLKEISLSESQRVDVGFGKRIATMDEDFDSQEPIRLTDKEGMLVAIGYFDREERAIKPRIVMI